MDMKIWTTERIRAEIKRLDKITGLKGADLPILFNNSKCTLGCFTVVCGKPKSFTFSQRYLEDVDFIEQAALDVFRHEYAHYMDLVLYGNSGHGKTWKKCCIKVGAHPNRLYNENMFLHHKKRREKEIEVANKIKQYKAGDRIAHPTFGEGTITDLSKYDVIRILFKNGEKTLNIPWFIEHCKKL